MATSEEEEEEGGRVCITVVGKQQNDLIPSYKKPIFSNEKLRYSGNCILISFTRSSEKILNPMSYSGFKCDSNI